MFVCEIIPGVIIFTLAFPFCVSVSMVNADKEKPLRSRTCDGIFFGDTIEGDVEQRPDFFALFGHLSDHIRDAKDKIQAS